MSVNSKMTAIANEIRDLSGTSEVMGLDSMATHIREANSEVDSQANLITQIKAALDGKVASSGDIGFEDEFVTRTITTYENSRVTTIGSSAFYYFTSLTSVSFPECTSIGSNAFYYCSNLTSVSFPKCIGIGNSAFRYCSNLTSVSFPKCTSIGSQAFCHCYRLESLYLTGSSICKLSASVAFSSTPYAGYSSYFSGTPYIYVPSSLLASYKSATNWAYFSKYFSAI